MTGDYAAERIRSDDAERRRAQERCAICQERRAVHVPDGCGSHRYAR